MSDLVYSDLPNSLLLHPVPAAWSMYGTVVAVLGWLFWVGRVPAFTFALNAVLFEEAGSISHQLSTLRRTMNDRSNRGSVTEPAAIMLLDAVERIFTNESPSAVSMRMIATEAGCSLGLAYNYYDSKMELIGTALDRMAKRIAAAATSTEDPREALLALLDTMRADAAFPRLVTWLVLEGHDVSNVMSGHPLIKSVAEAAAARGAEDPTSVAMTMGLVAIGTFTYSEMLNRAVGRQSDDGRLPEAAADMFASWFPQPAD